MFCARTCHTSICFDRDFLSLNSKKRKSAWPLLSYDSNMQKFMPFVGVKTWPKQKQFLTVMLCRPLTSSEDFVLSLRISWCLRQMLQLHTDILEENSQAAVAEEKHRPTGGLETVQCKVDLSR